MDEIVNSEIQKMLIQHLPVIGIVIGTGIFFWLGWSGKGFDREFLERCRLFEEPENALNGVIIRLALVSAMGTFLLSYAFSSLDFLVIPGAAELSKNGLDDSVFIRQLFLILSPLVGGMSFLLAFFVRWFRDYLNSRR
ncbi:MAG: hypothetical protein GY754_22050 [bacterium]|nr:hypothetical protein [bacterium]